MVTRIGSIRRKTRARMTKSPKSKGKISMTRYFQAFNVGDQVQLHVEPAVQKGIYHSRFFGMPGVISGKIGRSYTVDIKDRSKKKQLIVHPVHLIKIREVKNVKS